MFQKGSEEFVCQECCNAPAESVDDQSGAPRQGASSEGSYRHWATNVMSLEVGGSHVRPWNARFRAVACVGDVCAAQVPVHAEPDVKMLTVGTQV